MVIEKLEAYWSPEQIAGRLLADGLSLVRICAETIYRFIYGKEDYGLGLHRYLPEARRRRRPRGSRKPRNSVFPSSHRISQRPDFISERSKFGHWKGDLLIFELLQVDGYAGYNRPIASERVAPDIQLAYCWAHARAQAGGDYPQRSSPDCGGKASKGSASCIASKPNCASLIRRLVSLDGKSGQRYSLPTCMPGSSITAPVSRPNRRSARHWPISLNPGMVRSSP